MATDPVLSVNAEGVFLTGPGANLIGKLAGGAWVWTEHLEDRGDTGEVGIGSGITPDGHTGDAWLYTGESQHGDSGNVIIEAGRAGGAGHKQGDIRLSFPENTDGAERGHLMVSDLPTADPLVRGAVWIDLTTSGGWTLRVSSG